MKVQGREWSVLYLHTTYESHVEFYDIAKVGSIEIQTFPKFPNKKFYEHILKIKMAMSIFHTFIKSVVPNRKFLYNFL